MGYMEQGNGSEENTCNKSSGQGDNYRLGNVYIGSEDEHRPEVKNKDSWVKQLYLAGYINLPFSQVTSQLFESSH